MAAVSSDPGWIETALLGDGMYMATPFIFRRTVTESFQHNNRPRYFTDQLLD